MTQKFDQNVAIVFDNMVSEWGGLPCPELSVVLVHLRFLSLIHQTHHWITKGDAFYGDHQMFQRLYDDVQAEVDSLAERTVGIGKEESVNVVLQTQQVTRLVNGYGTISTIPQASEFVKRSLAAERNFITTAELAFNALKERCAMSRGLENLLSGILDTHETHLYLLKQRVS